MTPEGAILARPASTVRAGEERWVARRLADLGVPILRTLTGTAVFEGADLMWLDPRTAMIGLGLRTNEEAASQIATTLEEIGVETIAVRSEEHKSELQSLMRTSYAVCCLKKQTTPYRCTMQKREHTRNKQNI